MDKAPEAFRTISEVADMLRTPAHVLRFWESKFSQLRPLKRAGGRRYYRPADVALLAGIRKLLHDDGMTIRGVQKLLQENGVAHVADMTEARALLEGTGNAASDEIETAPQEAPASSRARVAAPTAPAEAEVIRIPSAREPVPQSVVEAESKQADSDPEQRLAARLRKLPAEALAASRPEARLLAQRLDSLVERMAGASGAGRW